MKLPKHKCGLYLEHNAHKDYYLTAEQELNENKFERYDEISEEDKKQCIELDSIWTLQWYPETPIGFYFVVGATLERVLELASSVDEVEK